MSADEANIFFAYSADVSSSFHLKETKVIAHVLRTVAVPFLLPLPFLTAQLQNLANISTLVTLEELSDTGLTTIGSTKDHIGAFGAFGAASVMNGRVAQFKGRWDHIRIVHSLQVTHQEFLVSKQVSEVPTHACRVRKRFGEVGKSDDHKPTVINPTYENA